MCNQNQFCVGCGNAVFTGKTICQSCSQDESRRGFLVAADDLDQWHYSDLDDAEATDFELEVASTLGESVEAIVAHGFQPWAPEDELAQNQEFDLGSMAKTKWDKDLARVTEKQWHLGA